MRLRAIHIVVLLFWLLLMLIVMAGIILSDLDSAKHQIQVSVNSHYQQVSDRVRTNEAVLEGFAALISSMHELDRQHIRKYAGKMLEQYPHIFMFEIIESVPHEKLESFVKHYRQTVDPDFNVKTFGFGSDRKMVPLKKQDIYRPVVFMEPYPPESRDVLGLDLNSHNFFSKSLDEYSQHKHILITQPFKLVEGNLAYLMYKPTSLQKISDTRTHIQRAAMLVIRADTLLSRENHPTAGMFELLHHQDFDATDNRGHLHLHHGAARSRLEQVIFPRYSSSVKLDNISQPFVLVNEYQLGWDALNWYQLLITLLTGIASFTVLMFYVNLYYRNEIKRLQTADELKQKVYELDLALEKAQQASKAKSMFLASMSHEIRTPMNGVLGMIQVLRGTSLSEEQKIYIETLDSSSKHLLLLIDDLLDLSKIESGKLVLNIESFETFNWVIDIQNLTEPFFENGSTVFITEVSDNLPAQLQGDAARLTQVTANLISNAAKCTPDGEVTLVVGGQSISDKQFYLQISVKDTGIGISEDNLKLIFEVFHQVELDRTVNKGVGLGLTICKRLVDIMDGSLHVTSEPGKGSCFTFSLVLSVPGERDQQGDAGEKTVIDRRLSILLVDDDPINRFSARTLLEQAGQDVTEASNGQLAIEKVNAQHFDVILMDIHMPVLDGIIATRTIRESGKHASQIPIIGLTASVMNDEKDFYLKAGMNAVVEKPILIEKLTATIQKLLQDHNI